MSAVGPVQVGRYLVPLTEPTVVQHFVDHHLVTHNLRERLCGWLARGSVALGLAPVAGCVLRTGCASRGPVVPWCRVVRQQSEEILREFGVGGECLRIHLVDRSTAGECGRGGLIYGFDRRDGRGPAVVLKIRERGGERAGLGREWQALRELRGRLPASLRDTLPEPLDYRFTDGFEMVAMACLPGRPAYVDLHNRLAFAGPVSRHLTAAVTWLATLHEAPEMARGSEDGTGLPDPQGLVAGTGPVGSPPLAGADLVWYEELREDLAGDPLRLTPAHGDYWARNLLLVGRRASGVVDWEHYRPRALPTTDLFHFLISYGLGLRWTRFRQSPALTAFQRTFVEDNRVSRAVRAAILTYSAARGMTVARLERLFSLHLLGHGRPRASSDDPPAPDVFPTAHDWESAYRIMRSSPRSVFTP